MAPREPIPTSRDPAPPSCASEPRQERPDMSTGPVTPLDPRAQRRQAFARRVIRILRRAVPPESGVELVLAGDDEHVRRAPARIVIASPDALARMLWPPSADALGEAYAAISTSKETSGRRSRPAARSASAGSVGTCLASSGSGSGCVSGPRPAHRSGGSPVCRASAIPGHAISRPSGSITTSATTSSPSGSTRGSSIRADTSNRRRRPSLTRRTRSST